MSKLFLLFLIGGAVFFSFKFDRPIPHSGVGANGLFHWMLNLEGKLALSSMDLEYTYWWDAYKLIKVPEEVENLTHWCDLTALNNDRLVLYCTKFGPGASHHFWILKEYGNNTSWIQLKFKFDVDLLAEHHFLVSIQFVKFPVICI